jgi:general secretion pathway protein M
MSGSTPDSPLSNLQDRWQTLAERDRRAMTLAAVLLSLFLFWILAIQPAWQTLEKAPAELARLETQLQSMNRMAQESRELRDVSPVPTTQALASLQAASDRLGKQGRISIQGDRATLTLTQANPEALKDWLSEVRSAARARPLEAQLNRTGNGYSGTILLAFGGTP